MFRKSLAAALALMIVLAAGAATAGHHWKKGIEGSGDQETRQLELGEFNRIAIGGAFELEASLGDEQQVAVTIDDNLWDNLVTEINGKTLRIGWKENCSPDVDCRLVVTVKELKGLDVHGASDVFIADFRGDSFEFDVSGAAELEMSGQVDDLKISVSGAGEINTRELKAKNVEISVSGAGEADVYASESFHGKVSGVGDITYWGDPEEKKTSVSGMGEIRGK